jgi:CheY-specific phosphatase CheX
MITTDVHLSREIANVIEVVERRTKSFLRDEFGLTAEVVDRSRGNETSIALRSMTAIVGVGSHSGLYIAYSYDDSLIRMLTQLYTRGLCIPPGEEEVYARETASDIVNVIVGHCTADLTRKGELVSLSPPVLLVGARTIQGRSETTVAALTLKFSFGALDIAFVAPRFCYDDQLSYKEGACA